MKLLRDGLVLFLRFSLTFKKELVNDANRKVVNNRFIMVKTVLQQAEDAALDLDQDIE